MKSAGFLEVQKLRLYLHLTFVACVERGGGRSSLRVQVVARVPEYRSQPVVILWLQGRGGPGRSIADVTHLRYLPQLLFGLDFRWTEILMRALP